MPTKLTLEYDLNEISGLKMQRVFFCNGKIVDLSDEEKLSKILKWKRLNADANLNKTENLGNSNLENNKVEIVFTDFKKLEKDHQKQLRKLWFTEARNGLKYGKIPQVKLVSSKKENNWIPQVNLQLKANTTYINASLIQ
jgi:hypothetical protein